MKVMCCIYDDDKIIVVRNHLPENFQHSSSDEEPEEEGVSRPPEWKSYFSCFVGLELKSDLDDRPSHTRGTRRFSDTSEDGFLFTISGIMASPVEAVSRSTTLNINTKADA